MGEGLSHFREAFNLAQSLTGVYSSDDLIGIFTISYLRYLILAHQLTYLLLCPS
jgi:hypothetical protein